MKKLNWEKIIHDTYVESYKNAEPKADFDELLANAAINELGQKEIPFMDYKIHPRVMDSIINNFESEYKMKKYDMSKYEFTIYLGCSPVSDPNCKNRLNSNE